MNVSDYLTNETIADIQRIVLNVTNGTTYNIENLYMIGMELGLLTNNETEATLDVEDTLRNMYKLAKGDLVTLIKSKETRRRRLFDGIRPFNLIGLIESRSYEKVAKIRDSMDTANVDLNSGNVTSSNTQNSVDCEVRITVADYLAERLAQLLEYFGYTVLVAQNRLIDPPERVVGNARHWFVVLCVLSALILCVTVYNVELCCTLVCCKFKSGAPVNRPSADGRGYYIPLS